ncbi:type II toxin-antitoxin system CcdA family antitoxin [Henriciella marina]|uniref:type II toxin-antitoxin system CcdA family antitoxin n=1 Tax=Henriciella marina TaxID=453851 RepID=UPI00037953D6|nr:type II toxin-antitoxin system CcdA family antitoxin [Henriciella marina]
MQLREWRQKAHLTSKEFGRLCGVSEAAIRHYETGARRPRADIAKRIEAATHGEVTAAELLGVTDPSTSGLSEETAPFVHTQIDSALISEAASYGLDAAEIARAAVERAVKTERMKRFSEENREAIESWNEHYKKHGLWNEKYRLF